MILHEWSGQDLATRHFLIPNDRVVLVFHSDKSQNGSGFLLHYEIIERGRFCGSTSLCSICILWLEKVIIELDQPNGSIYSKGYPVQLRTNAEYQWRIHMNGSDEIEIDLRDVHLDEEHDYLQILVGRRNDRRRTHSTCDFPPRADELCFDSAEIGKVSQW